MDAIFKDRDFTARLVATSSLRGRDRNPRTHSAKQLKKLVASLQEFGWTNPILVDEHDMILCGHGRWEAAKQLAMAKVPVITLSALTDAQKAAYVIADNAVAEKAGWSRKLLALELQGLIEVGFEVEITGFDTIEIDTTLAVLDSKDNDDEPGEIVPMPEPGPAVSQLGDLWTIGDHRILCGNALETPSFETLMAGALAELVFSDPPFNVSIQGNVSGLGQARHREFAMASGEMTPDAFTGFLRTSFRNMRAVSKAGAIHFICMDWRHQREVLDAAQGVYHELKNLCVWAKTNAGMGTFYRSQHEFVYAFKATKGATINNFGLGEGGRHRSNLWVYAGANTFRAGRLNDLESHPTCKPVRMVEDAIRDCSRRGGIVLDPFLGSGTTALAAARMGRKGYGIEIDPIYVDLIVRRLVEETGCVATHQDGRSFANVAADRGILIDAP